MTLREQAQVVDAHVGPILAAERSGSGLSRQSFARKLGLGYSATLHKEQSVNRWTVGQFVAACRCLKIDAVAALEVVIEAASPAGA